MNASPVMLRPYQIECVESVMAAKERGIRRALYVQPTGCGKTVTFAEVIRRVRQADARPALVLAHREELLEQAAHALNRMLPGNPLITMERAEQRASVHADVVVASIPTLARADSSRLEWLAQTGPSVIVYDEAHHSAAVGAERVLRRFGAFDARTLLVGCTATPHRLDAKALIGDGGDAIFQECVYRYNLLDAIKEGYLSDLRGFVVRTDTDLSGIKMVAGDFSEKELAKRINVAARTEKAATHWKEIASDRPTIVFCADVAHAIDAAAHFRAVGATAEHIDGGMDRDTRRAILDRFRSGHTQVLTNVMIATEGFDVPKISCVVMLRPTKSWSLYSQQAGRGTRLFQGKTDCIILDVVDNGDQHSLMGAPQLIDLPTGVDLDGMSLREAQEELDGLGDKAAFIPRDRPGKWRDLITTAREVPLFSVPPTPPELVGVGTMRWFKRGNSYVVSCGANKLRTVTFRMMHVEEGPLGWTLRTSFWERSRTASNTLILREAVLPYRPPAAPTAEATLRNAIRYAEGWIKNQWPTGAVVASANAAWTKGAPTDKQLVTLQNLARKRNIKGFDITTITTKGQASEAIDYLMNGAVAA